MSLDFVERVVAGSAKPTDDTRQTGRRVFAIGIIAPGSHLDFAIPLNPFQSKGRIVCYKDYLLRIFI